MSLKQKQDYLDATVVRHAIRVALPPSDQTSQNLHAVDSLRHNGVLPKPGKIY